MYSDPFRHVLSSKRQGLHLCKDPYRLHGPPFGTIWVLARGVNRRLVVKKCLGGLLKDLVSSSYPDDGDCSVGGLHSTHGNHF